ncbi:hypothetical protein GOP47_0030888 [Adiantum capillus-veneris]|nr:hypothetical protein GOP47_0030888 [Adiantum capillus-veneris]
MDLLSKSAKVGSIEDAKWVGLLSEIRLQSGDLGSIEDELYQMGSRPELRVRLRQPTEIQWRALWHAG